MSDSLAKTTCARACEGRRVLGGAASDWLPALSIKAAMSSEKERERRELIVEKRGCYFEITLG